ncbi:MAG: RidA family protein [Burkholderiales bacterium]|nr:RidA family protein [Burkholderiales bacterium]
MFERFYVTPKTTYTTGGNNKVLYTPVVVVKTSEAAHIYLAGRTARLPNGDVHPKGDMRGQIRLVCENIEQALASVGATFADVVKTTTYTTDIDEYYRVCDERFKFFKEPLPTSTLLGISRLGMPDMLVEIEVEALMEPARLRIPQ